jgi:WD40 repeat protein
MNTTQTNPYIGPRTFLKEEGHLFFGRDREARDLAALVASDQLVLFYAQSGAGKSSLINTRLIPELEDKLYEVLPVARVSGNWPEGPRAKNIYVYDLMRSLIRREVGSEALLDLSLSEFLVKLNEDEGGYFYDSSITTNLRKADEDFIPWRRALIIDQFEELFSTHPEAWEKREDFFNQLARAMRDDAYLWVVLVMREDYIASLDPYAHILPGGLRTRYYMQRLSREAAIQAVRKPVEKLRPYEPGVAEKLVEDLSSIKVQKPDGTQEMRPGQYVEPVQLQVVCYGLWQNLPAQGSSITARDLQEVGDVDEALGKYYAGRVAGVAEAKQVKERLIRDWIERKLIAPGGVRSMVMQETARKSGEVSDDVIRSLQSDLVRAENRAGVIWYELTHDRLVGPILTNNKKWFDENLSPLQRQASIWNDQERNESWLLRDQALVEVEDWAQANPDELTHLEQEFLQACREQQEQIKLNEQARSASRLRRFVAVISALLIFAVAAAVFGFIQSGRAATSAEIARQAAEKAREAEGTARVDKGIAEAASTLAVQNASTASAAQAEAELQADRALSGSLVAQANSLRNRDYPLALLLAMEAHARDEDSLLTRTTLFQMLQFTPYEREFGFRGVVSSVVVSPDGSLIAAASCTGEGQCSVGSISLFDAELNRIGTLPGEYGTVYSLAFHEHPDYPLVLAAGGCVPGAAGCSVSQGQITFWNVSDPGNPEWLSDTRDAPKPAHEGLVKTIAFSPDDTLLASGSYDTSILLWDISDLKQPHPAGEPLIDHTSFVNGLAFSHDSDLLVSGSDDSTIRLWNVANPAQASLVRTKLDARHTASVNGIAFSPDGKKFASVGNDGLVLLWDWNGSQSPPLTNASVLTGHTGYVKSVAFSHDGTLLASTGFDSRIILWDTGTGEQIGPALSVHSRAVNGIFFGVKVQDGSQLPYLISGSNDRTMIQWDLSARQPLSRTFEVERPPSPPEGQDGLTASNDKYCAQVNGPQIDITLPVDTNGGSCASDQPVNLSSGEDVFLTLAGFDSPVQYIEFEGPDSLLTWDQRQSSISRGTSRMTRWSIDPASWMERACEAVKPSLTETTRAELYERFLQRLQLDPGEQPRETCLSGQN